MSNKLPFQVGSAFVLVLVHVGNAFGMTQIVHIATGQDGKTAMLRSSDGTQVGAQCNSPAPIMEGLSVPTTYFSDVESGYSSYVERIECSNENAYARYSVFPGNVAILNPYGRNDQQSAILGGADWASGYFKADCPDGYAVFGIAQSNEKASAVFQVGCVATNMPRFSNCHLVEWPNTFATGEGCNNQEYVRNNTDWAWGYCKLECGLNEFIKGVALTQGGSITQPVIDIDPDQQLPEIITYRQSVKGIYCCNQW